VTVVTYNPSASGLVFHQSQKFLRFICGSPGGGKTVTVLLEILFLAMRQAPGNDGVRRHRCLIVRSTYARLRTTVLKSLKDWYPSEWGDIKQTAPMEGLYQFPLPDGTRVHLEIVALALEDEKSLDSMRSLECSSVYLNEVSEQDEAVMGIASMRVGRYPSPKTGAKCSQPSILADFNTVADDHWLYRWCVTEAPDNLEFVMQPPAMFCDNYDDWYNNGAVGQFRDNPDAPNLDMLRSGYYRDMLKTLSRAEIASFLLLKWVSVRTGKLVHHEFSRKDHLGKIRTQANADNPVFIGIDTSGLHPGAVFGQMQAGTLVLLDEVYGDDMAFEQYIQDALLPLIAERYSGCELLAICDPSNPRDARTGVTPTQLLQRYSIRALPAATNKFALRREAVSRMLNKRDGVVIDPALTTLVKGLAEEYCYRKLRGANSSGQAMYSSDAEKGAYSHVVDAFQYLCLHISRVADAVTVTPSLNLRKRRVV
jgi:hypothetical protein